MLSSSSRFAIGTVDRQTDYGHGRSYREPDIDTNDRAFVVIDDL